MFKKNVIKTLIEFLGHPVYLVIYCVQFLFCGVCYIGTVLEVTNLIQFNIGTPLFLKAQLSYLGKLDKYCWIRLMNNPCNLNLKIVTTLLLNCSLDLLFETIISNITYLWGQYSGDLNIPSEETFFGSTKWQVACAFFNITFLDSLCNLFSISTVFPLIFFKF